MALLTHEPRMHSTLGVEVCSAGFLAGRVSADGCGIAARAVDARAPFLRLLAVRDTQKAGRSVALWVAAVLLVRGAVYAAQIAQAIIRSVAVDVVNLIAGWFSVDVRPYESVHKVFSPEKPRSQIAIDIERTDFVTNCASPRPRQFPSEPASRGAVIEVMAG